MGDVLAAEWQKGWAGRAWWALALVALVLGGMAGIGFAMDADADIAAELTTIEVVTDQLVRSWFMTLLFSALYGAVYVTRDFSTGAIGRGVLLSGGRSRLLAAKVVVGTVIGVGFGLLAAAAAAGSPWLFLAGSAHDPVWTTETTLTLIGVFTVTVLGAPWGVLIGWIVRRQAAAVAALLVLTLLFDEALFRLLPSVGRFTMTIAMGSVYRDGKPEMLAVPVALLVIAAWLALAGFIARKLLLSRDVD